MIASNNKPLVSVLMPVYNGAAFLKEAIDSIIHQTYKNFELIIIIDGSTDQSESIVKSYADNRITCLKNRVNNGLVSSLNRGLLQAKGQLIARMDCDDISIDTRLEEQVKIFVNNPKVIITGTDFYHLTGNKSKISVTLNNSDYLKSILIFGTCFAHPTIMMRNIFIGLKISYEPAFKHAEDYRLWTKLALKGTFYNINKPLLYYRVHNSQITSVHREEQLSVSSQIRKDFLAHLGFRLSSDELAALDVVGNNEFIKSTKRLKEIEGLFMMLLSENERTQQFESQIFKKVLHKMWMDNCSNSNLGIKAMAIYVSSPLSKLDKISTSDKIKLTGKSLLRMFKL